VLNDFETSKISNLTRGMFRDEHTLTHQERAYFSRKRDPKKETKLFDVVCYR
jgi:hypothetical protein